MLASAPVEAGEFDSLMTACLPFEQAPHIAVGCSGGADSMALTLLLDRWVAGRKGRLTALIVDHGLRPESADEAQQTAEWLAARGIEARRFARDGECLHGNLHAAARSFRYRLMGEWCRAAGVLHLGLAHHREDQAATLLARLARGSGVDGLAAMAPVQEVEWGRLIRPLLPLPAARLRATLAAFGQPHAEDPSNRAERYQRTRLRALADEMSGHGPARLAATARRLGRARAILESLTGDVLARHAVLRPEGYSLIAESLIRKVPAELALRALAHLLACVAGREHPPREEPLERLYATLRSSQSAGMTLAGCRILRRGGEILICREPAAAIGRVPAAGRVDWDGRFRIAIARGAGCEIRRLGREGWQQVVAGAPTLRGSSVPPPVRPSLPALWRDGAVLCVPHLGYAAVGDAELPQVESIYFRPQRPLASAPFAIGGARPIL